MEIKRLILGPLQTNTYLIQEGNDVLLIDPASKSERLITEIQDRNLLGILLTHGHFDHLKAVDGLVAEYDCPVFLHQADEKIARDKDSGSLFGLCSYIKSPVTYLNEGKMNLGPFSFEVIFTPGHTMGSVIYVFEDDIFTGDTLFKMSVGRTDLEGGDARVLKDSLRVFYSFRKNYHIWPGHDEDSDLESELNYNPYL